MTVISALWVLPGGVSPAAGQPWRCPGRGGALSNLWAADCKATIQVECAEFPSSRPDLGAGDRRWDGRAQALITRSASALSLRSVFGGPLFYFKGSQLFNALTVAKQRLFSSNKAMQNSALNLSLIDVPQSLLARQMGLCP